MRKALCGSMMSALFASSALAQARSARLAGTVRDSSGTPVALAQLSIGDVRATSDSAGRFVLAELAAGPGTLQVRRLGFAPLDVALDLTVGRTDTLLLVLAAVPQELTGVTAEAEARLRMRLSDFYRHRQNSSGYYFDRKEIVASRVHRTSDLLRRLPGVRLMPDRNGRYQLRMARASGARDCPPDFWIDGIRAPLLNVDDLPLNDIEALEVYRGLSAMPPEYTGRLGNPSCGAVVIWTRLPG